MTKIDLIALCAGIFLMGGSAGAVLMQNLERSPIMAQHSDDWVAARNDCEEGPRRPHESLRAQQSRCANQADKKILGE